MVFSSLDLYVDISCDHSVSFRIITVLTPLGWYPSFHTCPANPRYVDTTVEFRLNLCDDGVIRLVSRPPYLLCQGSKAQCAATKLSRPFHKSESVSRRSSDSKGSLTSFSSKCSSACTTMPSHIRPIFAFNILLISVGSILSVGDCLMF